MSSAVMTIHFPNGEHEFRSTIEPPKPGDLMKCRGADWIVSDAADGSGVISLMSKRHQDAVASFG